MFERIEEIHELGFEVSIFWKDEFSVYLGDNIEILNCKYDKNQLYTFEEMVILCCDEFANWYNLR
jgi:hypothetical protein